MVRLDLIEAGIRREKEEDELEHCQEKKDGSDSSNNYHYTNHDSHFQSNSLSINSCNELREKPVRLHDEREDTALLSKRSVNGSDSANGSVNDVAGVLLTGKRNLLKFDIGNIEDSDQESMSRYGIPNGFVLIHTILIFHFTVERNIRSYSNEFHYLHCIKYLNENLRTSNLTLCLVMTLYYWSHDYYYWSHDYYRSWSINYVLFALDYMRL